MKYVCNKCKMVFDTEIDHNINVIDLGVHVSQHEHKMVLPSQAMQYFRREK